MSEPAMPFECDGYPPMPLDGDFEAIRRHANVMMLAEMLRAEEDIDERMLGIPQQRATPAARWARAEELFDQMAAERIERDRRDAERAERIAADPELYRMQEAFDDAKEACRVGHDAGCTYGGMSALHGYWLGGEDCPENHGALCDLRIVCDGADAVTGFVGRDLADWIWMVAACQSCADAYVAKNPEYTRQEAAADG